MTPNINSWMGQNTGWLDEPSAANRAVRAWIRIQDRPASIKFYRNGSMNVEQIVRVEFDSTRQRDMKDEAGTASQIDVTIFGVQDHPDEAVEDTDLQDDDAFIYEGNSYIVKDVLWLPGEVQAQASRVSK